MFSRKYLLIYAILINLIIIAIVNIVYDNSRKTENKLEDEFQYTALKDYKLEEEIHNTRNHTSLNNSIQENYKFEEENLKNITNVTISTFSTSFEGKFQNNVTNHTILNNSTVKDLKFEDVSRNITNTTISIPLTPSEIGFQNIANLTILISSPSLEIGFQNVTNVTILNSSTNLEKKFQNITNGTVLTSSAEIFGTEIQNITDDKILTTSTLNTIKNILMCKDKEFESRIRRRGDHWVFYNYIKAEHGPLGCHESITFTTHGDFTFLDNLIPLLKRWNNPVSLAMHTPSTDFQSTVDSIRFLRDCEDGNDLVKKWVTFHLYFDDKHMPNNITNINELLSIPFNCSSPAPYNVETNSTYKSKNNMMYPINVGRNVARESALTHFVFACDVELYPSPNLVSKFLNLVARNPPELADFKTRPRVYPLALFEVQKDKEVPENKTKLISMLKEGSAIPFHSKLCAACHNVPKYNEWVNANETDYLNVFHTEKRKGEFKNWEPIFIATNAEPFYDERLSWEGKSDKMTQGYALCVLDYDYMILDNAFLVHKPGIKIYAPDMKRDLLALKTSNLIASTILPEMKIVYGTREGCVV